MIEQGCNRDTVIAANFADGIDCTPARQLIVEPTRGKQRYVGAEHSRRLVVDQLCVKRCNIIEIDAGEMRRNGAHRQHVVARGPHRS